MSEEVENKEELKAETPASEVVEPKKGKKEKKPKSKARKIIEWVLTGLFLVIFGIVMYGQIDGMIHRKDHYNQQIRLGFATFVVQTESMEPEIKKNTAIITYLEDVNKIVDRFNKGEKVDLTFMDIAFDSVVPEREENKYLSTQTNAFSPTGIPMTHRLREIQINPDKPVGQGHYIFITAGINNSVAAATDSEGNIIQYQAFSEKEILGRVVANSAFLGGVFSFIGSPFGLLALLLIPAFYLVITSVLDIFKAYKDPEEASATNSGANKNAEGNVELSEEDKKRLKEELLKEMIEKKKGGSQ